MFNIVKSALIPLAINCKNLRIERQNKNDSNVLENILSENITEKKLSPLSDKELGEICLSLKLDYYTTPVATTRVFSHFG